MAMRRDFNGYLETIVNITRIEEVAFHISIQQQMIHVHRLATDFQPQIVQNQPVFTVTEVMINVINCNLLSRQTLQSVRL